MLSLGLLGILGMSGQGLALVVLSGVSAVAGAKWLFGRDEAREDRKREMIKLISHLREQGYGKIPDFIEDMVVGDISAIGYKLKGLLEELRTPEGRLKLSDELFTKQLQAHMNDESRRPEIIQAIEQFTTLKESNDAKVVANASTTTGRIGS